MLCGSVTNSLSICLWFIKSFDMPDAVATTIIFDIAHANLFLFRGLLC